MPQNRGAARQTAFFHSNVYITRLGISNFTANITIEN